MNTNDPILFQQIAAAAGWSSSEVMLLSGVAAAIVHALHRIAGTPGGLCGMLGRFLHGPTTISAAPDKSDLPQPITAGQATGAAGK